MLVTITKIRGKWTFDPPQNESPEAIHVAEVPDSCTFVIDPPEKFLRLAATPPRTLPTLISASALAHLIQQILERQ